MMIYSYILLSFTRFLLHFLNNSHIAIIPIKYIKRLLFEALLNKGTLPQKGGVPERSNGAGCKPVDFGLRKFESFPLHQTLVVFNNKERNKFG